MIEESEKQQGLPPVSPDQGEVDLELDNVVPTRGYNMLPMVALGGSAGSIPSLRSFFEAMPADSGLVFVVIVHLSPEHESALAEVIQKSTSMPVTQVHTMVKVRPNSVYVIPPGKMLTAMDGHLRLIDLPADRARRAAVDLFFRSMADSYGPHAMAIVLSGADSDGAVGIKRIKERGGLTIAQDPDEAEHGGMPRAAIATGMVDWVLQVKEMPARLIDYCRLENEISLPPEEGPQSATAPRVADNQAEMALRDVLTYLRTRTGRDFSYYKRATILRRISRRLQVNGLSDLPAYFSFLRTHPGEAGALLQDLLISVTNFFRDREAFEALEKVIPSLFQGKGSSDSVRVWVPACATGEEAYSIAILLCEYARRLDTPPIIQIFATDLDEDVIQLARDGVFPETISADVSEDRLRRFFVKEHRGYRVRREVREIVLFAVHDLLKDSPFSRLDLISCRNLLIYLNRDAQTRVFDIFHFALRPQGKLFLGSSESIDEDGDLFSVIDKKHRLYSHRSAMRVGLPIPSGPSTLALAYEEQQRSKDGPVISRRALEANTVLSALRAEPPGDRSAPWSEVHFKLIERFAPPSVIVNAEYDILHLSENAGRFLHLSGGEPSRNLLRLVHPMLRIELRAALYRAAQTADQSPEQTQRVVGVPIEFEGRRSIVTISVTPAEDIAPGAMLVVFDSHAAGPDAELGEAVRREEEPVARDLERELERMKSHLRDIVEQYEASTEELKAGNEELQAMNEELRSATEELETSREELQSINEELTTVNLELKRKVDELGTANSDLHNLMASTAIATVFLDRDLCITRYTPPAVDIFRLIPTDVGRPLSDLTHRLNYPELQADASSVLETLKPIERNVGEHEGRSFLARLLPYRTIEDRIGGVVLTFVDVTEQRRADELVRESDVGFQSIFELSSVGMAQGDPESGKLLRVNQRMCSILGHSRATLETMTFEQVTYPEDRQAIRDAFQSLAKGLTQEFSCEKRLIRNDGRPTWVHLNVTTLRAPDGRAKRLIAVILDIEERRRAEEALRHSEEKLRSANADLETYVAERTKDLHASEVQLKKMNATANQRSNQLQLLATQLSKVEQQERRRLAAVLHDHVQQILVAAKMRLELATSDLKEPTAQQQLVEVNQMLDETISTARTLAVELAPPLLHDQGLAPALEWLASRMEDLHKLKVHVDVSADANPATTEQRDLMFQAARELLLNVVKHAGTSQVWLKLTAVDGKSRLEIADKGVGFNPASLQTERKGFGLLYLRERLEAAGGTIAIDSKPKKGSKVVVTIGERA